MLVPISSSYVFLSLHTYSSTEFGSKSMRDLPRRVISIRSQKKSQRFSTVMIIKFYSRISEKEKLIPFVLCFPGRWNITISTILYGVVLFHTRRLNGMYQRAENKFWKGFWNKYYVHSNQVRKDLRCSFNQCAPTHSIIVTYCAKVEEPIRMQLWICALRKYKLKYLLCRVEYSKNLRFTVNSLI